MPTRIDAEIGLNASKFITGMAQATSALEAFKSKADFAGSSIAISISKASDTAVKGAREIKTEFSDSADEIADALKRSGTLSENWANGLTADAMAASKAFSLTSDRVVTSLDRAAVDLKRGFGKGVINPSLYTDLRLLDKGLESVSLEATQTGNAVASASNRMAGSMRTASGAQTGLSKSTRGTSAAAIEFSRIIGDAPYGIRGMANNIQQLAFVMGASGGLIFAITAATAALDFFFGANKKAKKGVEDLSVAVKSLGEFLREGEAAAQSEIITLGTLRKIAEDEGQSRKDRLSTVKEMRDQYPSLLKNFSDEEILAGKAAIAYTKLAAAITATAIAHSFEDAAKEKAKQRIQTELNLAETIEKRIKAERDLAKVQSSGTIGDATTAGVDLRPILLQREVNSLKASELAYTKQLRQEAAQIISYSNKSYEAISKVAGATEQFLGGGGEDGGSKTRKEIDRITNSVAQRQKGITDINAMSVGTRQAAGLAGIALPNLPDPTKITSEYASYGEITGDAFSEAFSDTLSSGVADGIASMAGAFGKALSEGGNVVQAIGSTLLQGIGAIAVELGKQAIAIGVGMLAIKASFKNPFTAIAAGVALVAIGSAINNAGNVTSGIGSGGGGNSASNTGSNTTTVSQANVSGSMGTVVFEIAGRSLVGVLKREAQHGNRITP